MGEIKSTLDLVLEKTRHLTLNTDEKRAHQQARASARIKGLLQKYCDGLMRLDEALKEYRLVRNQFKLDDDGMLVSVVLEQINLDSEIGGGMELLAAVCGEKQANAVRETVESFYRQLAEAAAEADNQALRDLERSHSLSGSAVVANRETDPGFRKRKEELNARLSAALKRCRENILQTATD